MIFVETRKTITVTNWIIRYSDRILLDPAAFIPLTNRYRTQAAWLAGRPTAGLPSSWLNYCDMVGKWPERMLFLKQGDCKRGVNLYGSNHYSRVCPGIQYHFSYWAFPTFLLSVCHLLCPFFFFFSSVHLLQTSRIYHILRDWSGNWKWLVVLSSVKIRKHLSLSLSQASTLPPPSPKHWSV